MTMNPTPITLQSRRGSLNDPLETLPPLGLKGERGVDKLTGAVGFWEMLQSSAAEGLLQSGAAASPVVAAQKTSPKKEAPKPEGEKALSQEAAARLQGNNGPTDEVHLKTPIKPDDERFLEWMLETASAQAAPANGMAVGWQPLLAQLPLQWGQPTDDGSGGASSVASTMGDSVQAWLKGDAMRGKTLRVSLAGQADLILKIHAGKVQAQFVGYDAGMMGVLQQTSRDLQEHLASKQLPVDSITWRDESRPSQQGQQPEKQTQPEDSDGEQAN
ncbi:MAG: hypothetical protein QE263_03520 [Vampirovibrionales bacterium]|nr:hypothetical protein [Vampirovibrionales bacterium]